MWIIKTLEKVIPSIVESISYNLFTWDLKEYRDANGGEWGGDFGGFCCNFCFIKGSIACACFVCLVHYRVPIQSINPAIWRKKMPFLIVLPCLVISLVCFSFPASTTRRLKGAARILIPADGQLPGWIMVSPLASTQTIELGASFFFPCGMESGPVVTASWFLASQVAPCVEGAHF